MDTLHIDNIPFETDPEFDHRPSIGLIVLASDHTIEDEFRLISQKFPPIRLHHSRISNVDRVTPDSLRDMEHRIAECSALLTPGSDIDVVAYGCTSASTAITEDRVFELIRSSKPRARCTTPITAAFAAFTAFGATRIGLLTPYVKEVNAIVAEYIRNRGYEVPIFGSFNEGLDSVVSRISAQSVMDAVHRILDKADVDAVFVSCTSVRLVEFCERLETDIRLPVTTSNHAMAWHALRLAGLEHRPDGLGSLYRMPLPKRL